MNIIDFHCDTISKLLCENKGNSLYSNSFSVDIKKLRKANSIAQFFALFISLEKNQDPLDICLKMLDKFYTEIDKNKSDIRLCKNYNDLIKNISKGYISAFLTIEEGAALKGNLYNLRNFYRLGVRLITLTWNFPNEIGYPNYKKTFINKGLTTFGFEVIEEMNNLGMLIDVSHLSDAGFYDVAKCSKYPFVASHSNSRSVTDHPRNLKDDMIKILADKGGILGINFEKTFLGNKSISRVEDMVSHITHIRNIGGIDVISLGSDFDGISDGLEMKNIGEISKLISSLKNHGFSEDEIEKICCKNALRVIKDVLK